MIPRMSDDVVLKDGRVVLLPPSVRALWRANVYVLVGTHGNRAQTVRLSGRPSTRDVVNAVVALTGGGSLAGESRHFVALGESRAQPASAGHERAGPVPPEQRGGGQR